MTGDGSEERGLHTHIGSMFDGVVCADAAELAEVYGGPVFEPVRWPVAVETVHYVLAAQPPSPPFPAQPPSYHIFPTTSDDAAPVIVHGFAEPSSVVDAQSGWRALDELADVEGFVREFAGTAQVVLRRDGQTVQLGTFTTVADAIATARSLRRVDPPS